jgi:hypothetical protein
VVSATQFARYPPLYYLIVGVPSLLATGSGALYGMQLTAAVLDAALIALGLFLLSYHPRRLSVIGALVALSPMVLFISGVVNSSGMETAAAFAAWCGGLSVVARPTVPLRLAVGTSVSFVLLILSRPISPVNAAVIAVVLGVLVGWKRAHAVVRARDVRPVWVSIVVGVVLFSVSVITLGVPAPLLVAVTRPAGLLSNMWLTLRLTGGRLRQCVGDFGWLDTPAPRWVVIVWVAVLAGLLMYGLVISPRCRRALPLLALAIVAMPLVFESPQINSVGPYWQGRYWLPLVIGLPLVAASGARKLVPSVQQTGLACGALLGVAQIAAFLAALHRYEGTTWAPPGGATFVVGLFVAGQILLLGFVWKTTKSPSTEVEGEKVAGAQRL